MNNILIIGASGHAKVIIDIVERQNNYKVYGLIDSFKEKGAEVFGYKILGTEDDLTELVAKHQIMGCIIAIGDNWERMSISIKINTILKDFKDFKFITAVHPKSCIGKNVHIGEGSVIMAGTVVNSDTNIGKHCILNTISSLDHDGVIGDFSSIAPGSIIGGNVTIGKCSAISIGAIVKENISIGNYTVVGAGSVVLKDIGNNKLAYGTPAKVIRDRKGDDPYLFGNKKKSFSLEVWPLKTKKDFDKYNAFLSNFKEDNPFYGIELIDIKNNDASKSYYFAFKKKNEVLVIMPFNLNKINSSKINGYFDVTSPYGYSGPLMDENISNLDLIEFWKSVDAWYDKNNIVTEFIRFNLDNNHLHYSGNLVPTLNNIKGEITNFELLWNNFKQKVRNNYRKAQKNNLSIKIYSGIITPDIIDSFFLIYTKTMERKAASKSYFYTKNYFKNLIQNNQEKILLTIVYNETTPISTELIIIHNDTLYSHLGGTLSEYFGHRPNDFLKIEVIKWAIKNNKKYYVLGGGRKDFDGLYQYKKSFFPNDEDIVFYTGRKVINKDVYNDLIKEIQVDYTNVNSLLSNSDNYFPIYKQTGTFKPSNFEINIITSKDEWKRFLDEVDNFDFYHTYDYHEISKREDEKAVLIKYTEGNILIGLPLIIRKVKDSNCFDATSVYGYSGPLQKNVDGSFNNTSFKKAINQFFKEENIISVFSRLNPFIENQSYIIKGIGETVELGNVVNIDLTKDLDEQRTIYSRTSKRYLNKGRKLLDVKIGNSVDDIKTFKELYYENMDRVNAKRNYYFTEEYFHKFINSNDFKTDVLLAFNKETHEIISAALMVKTNNIIQYHLSGTKTSFLYLSPMRLLIDEMRIRGTKEKYIYFNLGGGLGNEEDELFRFKSSFSKDFKPFKIWKYIVNQDIYNQLVKDKYIDDNLTFFPLYRYIE